MNKKRLMSFVLSVCMILSAVSIQTVSVEAAELTNINFAVSTGNENFKLPTSAVNYVRGDEISGDSGKVYAKWRNVYQDMDNNRLDFTFHIQDGMTYTLSVENAINTDIGANDPWQTPVLAEILKVTLKIKDYTDASNPDKYRYLTGLKLYDPKTNSDLTISPTTVTGDRRFSFAKADKNESTPDKTAAVFLIKSSTGVSLTDDLNNKITFYWDTDKNFYIVVDKLNGLPSDGKIFDFTLSGEDIGPNATPGVPNTDAFAPVTKYICTGYNDAIRSVPFAKDDENDNEEYPGYHLDTFEDPQSPHPGVDTGINLYVNFPKFWDDESHSFIQKTDNSNLVFSMKLNLLGAPATDITITNIYSQNSASYSTASPNLTDSGASRIKTSKDGEQVLFTFSHLETSTVYDSAYLQVDCKEGQTTLLGTTYFELSSKNIFTYPEYFIAADGTDDFYIEITPFKYANGKYISGDYTIYEIDYPTPPLSENEFYNYQTFSAPKYKLETRYYKAGDGKPMITLNKNGKAASSTLCWYFITFESETAPKRYLNSQFYRYQSNISDVRLGTPEIVEPIGSKVVSALNDKNELYLSIDWKMGMINVLENSFGALEAEYVDYVFKKGYTSQSSTAIGNPEDNTDFAPFVALRVKQFQTEDGDNYYTISLPKDPEDLVKYPYNAELQLMTAPEDTFYTKSMIVSGQSFDNAYGHAEIKIPIYHIDAPGKPSDANCFYFPDTCLIESYATYDMKDASGAVVKTYTGISVRKIITVNALDTMEVPTPQNVKVVSNSVTRASFQMVWTPVSTHDYEQVEVTPKRRVLLNNYPDPEKGFTDSTTYNVYISTSKQNMTMLADFFKNDTQLKTAAFYGDESTLPKDLREFLPRIVTVDTGSLIPSTSVMNFANTGDESEIPITVNEADDTQIPGLKYLREEKILKISNIKQVDTEFVLNFAGLDENQVYYVMLETQVSPYLQAYDTDKNPPVALYDENNLAQIIQDESENEKYESTYIIEEKTGFSKYSVLITITTQPEGESPDPSEIPPSSPTGVDKKNVTGNSATVFWNRMTELSSKDYNGRKYQILRIRGDQLPTALINSNIPADKFVAQLDSKLEPMVWQTNGESNLLTLKGSKFSLYNGGTTPSYSYLTTEKFHELSDFSLRPNQLYMYYVRTVTLVPDANDSSKYTDEIYSHSVWVPVSVTTDPVQPPINLKIEHEKITDPKTTTIVSFDAPITKDKLGTSNYFGIMITEEGTDLTERVINSAADISALYNSAEASTEEGHTHFQYTITGLKPGKSYIIKIRMYDIPLGDWSPYSVTARTRTEVDDTDYDYHADLDKWTKHYVSKIEALLKNPLWQTSDPSSSTTAFIAEIRNSTFDAELQKSTDGLVLLGQKGNTSQSYYIPLSVIQKANNAQKGFLISFGNQEIVIQKSTFDKSATKEIQTALQLPTNADIFIKIDAAVAQYTSPVNSTTPVSPSITMSFSVIGTKTSEKQWDKEVYTQLESYVKNESMMSVFNTLLGQQINANATDEQLVKFVDQQIDNVKQTLITMTRNSFNNIINSSYIIGATTKPFIVKSTVDDTASVGGYYNQGGSWQKQNQVSQYGNKAGIVSNLAGMYIFAGNQVVTPTISGLQNVAELSSVYAKYGLNDYLGTDTTQINSTNASVGTVAGVTARIMGASATEDPLEYLKSKGYQINSAGKTANIQTQQAIYLMMALYEQKTNTKIDTLKIKNYNATANISGIDPKYNKCILAAIELGLVDIEVLQPRQAVLTSDYIKMLSQLAKKVKL